MSFAAYPLFPIALVVSPNHHVLKLCQGGSEFQLVLRSGKHNIYFLSGMPDLLTNRVFGGSLFPSTPTNEHYIPLGDLPVYDFPPWPNYHSRRSGQIRTSS